MQLHTNWRGLPPHVSADDEGLLDSDAGPTPTAGRAWCYTRVNRDRSTEWGYCDCDGDESWTRQFDRLSFLNTAHAGGDVEAITDELHHPITAIDCPLVWEGITAQLHDNCRVTTY